MAGLQRLEVEKAQATSVVHISDKQQEFILASIACVSHDFFGEDLTALFHRSNSISLRREFSDNLRVFVGVTRVHLESADQSYDGLKYIFLIGRGGEVLYDLESVRIIEPGELETFLHLCNHFDEIEEVARMVKVTDIISQWRIQIAAFGEYSSVLDPEEALDIIPS